MLSECVNRKLQSSQLRIDKEDNCGLRMATAQCDTIMMAPVDNNCEMYMETGRSYLIYADWSDGMLFTNACTRSGLLAGHRDLKFLERKRRSK